MHRSLAADPTLPGIIATVVSDRHGVRWSGAVGAMTHGGDAALTPDHAFRIASVTKTFVAATALRLVEQQRLALFSPAARWLSQHMRRALAGNGHPVDAITPFQLLTHTAGFCDHGSHPDYAAQILADPGHVWTRAEQIERAMTFGPPLGPPGAQFSYSDTGYVVMGELVENVTGLPLASAVRTLLDFDRLGLGATFWEKVEPAPEALARAGQYFGEVPVATIDPTADLFGGGGLVSTTGDLVRFVRALLRGRLFAFPETLAIGLLVPALSIGEATYIHSTLLRSKVIGGRPCWSHGGFWGVQVVDFADADVTLALTYNQVKCNAETAGEIGRDGLVDRIARLALAGIGE